ncbi:MAG TPA: hypothetical protein VNT30_09390 [Stellaceae bacterium]|nr:hypothetical protein [Stellaceae bacterium]
MSLGDSIISICNTALFALGEDPISSLGDPTKRAILCKARFDPVRRAVLRAYPWNCAKKQAQLAAAATPPLFTYANAYPLPPDFLRMYDLPESDKAQWEIIGRQLLTDEGAPLDVVYIQDLTDPTVMDPLLVECIGDQLAAELAQPLTQSQAKQQGMLTVLKGKLDAARLADSQQNSPVEWDEDIWLRSRR